MDEQNEQATEEVELQEEVTTPEEEILELDEETHEEESITLSKADYKKLQRKAIAYDSTKSNPKPKEASYQVTPETLERIELRQDGYSKEEVEAIMELGGNKALSNPIVKSAIDAMRNKSKSQDSNQSLTSKSPVFKKFTQSDLNKMSSAELEAILPRD